MPFPPLLSRIAVPLRSPALRVACSQGSEITAGVLKRTFNPLCTCVHVSLMTSAVRNAANRSMKSQSCCEMHRPRTTHFLCVGAIVCVRVCLRSPGRVERRAADFAHQPRGAQLPPRASVPEPENAVGASGDEPRSGRVRRQGFARLGVSLRRFRVIGN